MGKSRDIADAIHALRAEGKTYGQIREVTGASKSTISYHVGTGNENERVKSRGYRKRIREFIVYYKEANPCVDCNNYYPFCVMQFDHLPEFEKSFNIARFHEHTASLSEVKAEMAKCDLVCGNCHAIRGHIRRIEKATTPEELETLIESELG